MSDIHLTIDDRPVTVPEGTTLLEAAQQAGVTIPTLCYHQDLTPVGACRLCVVQVAGRETPVAACTEPVREGVRVSTETEHIAAERRHLLEMLLAEGSFHDFAEDCEPTTEFGRWVKHYGAKRPDWSASEPRFSDDSDPNPFIRVNFNECILCTRCVRACAEIQGRFVWGLGERGRETRIIAGADTTMLDARCESCGACVAYCPTKALTDRMSPSELTVDRKVRTTCTYCGVGCQLDLNVADDKVIGVTSVESGVGVNGMSLCVKGRYGFDFIHHPERLTKPRVRRELIDGGTRTPGTPRGEWVEVEWDTACDIVARKFHQIRDESGADSLGFFSSAKCSNEENYLVQKLARQVFGTHNVDHCARLCHSSTVAGLAMAFGSGAMSNSMDDIAESAAALFVIGSNTTEQHPVFGTMLRQAVQQRKIPLIVADPRRIDLTEFATLHLRQKPGTDVALINGLMYLILEHHAEDAEFIRERCENYDEFRETVLRYPPDRVCELTGIAERDLQTAAEILSRHRPTAVIWAMGITQHTTGVLNVLSLANLQMLLGNMGIPGGGVNPLRGQNNVQGACDLGALPNVFPGYQAVTDETIRAKFRTAWKLQHDPNSGSDTMFSAQPGLTVTEMIDRLGTGGLRGLYILGENPVMTDPNTNHVRECLNSAEFVVLQEIFPSETSHYADVLLPGTTFAERSGTFTNTDRRIQLFHAAISPRGDSRPDWQVIQELAVRSLRLQRRAPAGPHADWKHDSPDSIMQEIAALTPQYAGVTCERLRSGLRLQWPVPDANHPGTPILHLERFTRGKGRFHSVDHLPPRECPDEEYPFLMTTGRVLYHWHGGEMTRRSKGLAAVYDVSLVEVSPEDAIRLGIDQGQTIRIFSRRGEMLATAEITHRVSAGLLFGNFHFPGMHNVNNVTIDALDPTAKIPEYKVCAVRIETN
ncbi:MAG TPA: formate dehydrogenase subunit alpha [Planctomycetaceae bacterium]|nr:formate dehydrogenase subunit alpha [Planctomycetaceae bacterium]